MLCLNYLNKTVELLFILYNFAIVPSVGTGIKTKSRLIKSLIYASYPPWVRGLKQFLHPYPGLYMVSYPPWVRGLKQ